MKQTLLILALSAGICVSSSAQLARIQYEDAETAYTEGRFKDALRLLEESEKTAKKTNFLILHLRILSNVELIKQDPYQGYDIIGQTRADINSFLKKYDGDKRAEDKYREVYEVSKQLKQLPATKEAYDAMLAEKRQQDAEQARIEKEEKAAYTKARSLGEALMKEFRYKPNCTLSELTAMNSSAAALANKKLQCYQNRCSYSSIKVLGNPYPEGARSIDFWPGSRTKVQSYSHTLRSGKNKEAEVLEKYNELRNRILTTVDKKYITENEKQRIAFLVPGLDVKVTVVVYSYNNWFATTISFTQ